MRVIRKPTLAFVLGAAAAALVVILSSGVDRPLADDGEEGGEPIFMAQKCNMCHAVSSADIEAKAKSASMLGPDLTGKPAERDAEWLAKYLTKQEKLDGKDHKKEFKGSDEELKELIAWLQTLK